MSNFSQKHGIITPCPKHKKMPNVTVCGDCLGDMGQFSSMAEQALQRMPLVMAQLHQEGLGYFMVLRKIAEDPNIRCLCGAGSADQAGVGHDDQCAIGIARRAIAGWEERILNKPATSNLMEVKQELVTASEEAAVEAKKSRLIT